MTVHVLWSGEGDAEFLVLEGDRVELRSTVPFAPGSRPTGSLATAPGQAVWLKVHRSRREEDGRFHVWGRLLNVTRELRAHLDAIALVRASVGASPAAPHSTPLSPTSGLTGPTASSGRSVSMTGTSPSSASSDSCPKIPAALDHSSRTCGDDHKESSS